METKKPLMKRWYIEATLVIIAIVAAYLIYDSFMAGYREGTLKAEQTQDK